MKTILCFFFINLVFDICAQENGNSYSKLNSKLSWDIKNEISYKLIIEESDLDTFTNSIFSNQIIDSICNIKQNKNKVFEFNEATIKIIPLSDSSLRMNIVNKEFKESYNKVKGLLFQTEFILGNNINKNSFQMDEYYIFYDLIFETVNNYKPEHKIIEVPIIDFGNFISMTNSRFYKSYHFDSLGNSLPDNHLNIKNINVVNKDTIVEFFGNSNFIIDGNLAFEKIKNDSICLDINLQLTINYSLRNNQILDLNALFFINSIGDMIIKKKIYTKLVKE